MAESKIGLNGQEASRCLAGIEESYGGLINGFNNLQEGVINKLGNSWYGQDAVQFVNTKFIPAIKSATDEIQKVFKSINDTITQNAKNYEAKHQVNVFSPVAHVMRSVTLNAGTVKPDDGGFIGIKSVSVLKEGINGAQKLVNETIAKLSEAKSAAARSGFYGEGQQARLDASMAKIKANLEDLSRELKKATEAKIQDVETTEKQIAQKNASTF